MLVAADGEVAYTLWSHHIKDSHGDYSSSLCMKISTVFAHMDTHNIAYAKRTHKGRIARTEKEKTSRTCQGFASARNNKNNKRLQINKCTPHEAPEVEKRITTNE